MSRASRPFGHPFVTQARIKLEFLTINITEENEDRVEGVERCYFVTLT